MRHCVFMQLILEGIGVLLIFASSIDLHHRTELAEELEQELIFQLVLFAPLLSLLQSVLENVLIDVCLELLLLDYVEFLLNLRYRLVVLQRHVGDKLVVHVAGVSILHCHLGDVKSLVSHVVIRLALLLSSIPLLLGFLLSLGRRAGTAPVDDPLHRIHRFEVLLEADGE